MPKHLFLCRHAHTQEAKKDQRDFDRQLSPVGLSEAEATGNFISGFNLKPGAIICSAALRTRKTAEIISEKNNFNPAEITVSEAFYEAPASTLLKTITLLPADLEVVVVVGHNPAISELASSLINQYRRQVPTGGCCYFSFNEPTWNAVEYADLKVRLSF